MTIITILFALSVLILSLSTFWLGTVADKENKEGSFLLYTIGTLTGVLLVVILFMASLGNYQTTVIKLYKENPSVKLNGFEKEMVIDYLTNLKKEKLSKELAIEGK